MSLTKTNDTGMAGAVQLPSFVHGPLPDSATHIRLLEILHGNFEQHVVCAMSVWPLDTAPLYGAVSYTWGDPALTVQITIDGRTMVVRQNCEYVLQQMFTIEKKAKYVWVDAACINQSNVKERGHQVAMMGQVYGRAAQVFACVGSHSDGSDFLLSFCRKKKRLLENIYTVLHTRPDTYTLYLNLKDETWLAMKCFRTILSPLGSKVTKAVLAFLSRPYFTRASILQELHMASNVTYCVGPDVLPADRVLALSTLY
jgi:hypothetical protein